MHLPLPPVILGTSTLGNLYTALPQERKTAIVKAFVEASSKPFVFDSAGKYGAGLALESLGIALKELGVAPNDVIISNKLGWYRVPLTTPEPTFEPGVWHNLKFDAVQRMGYEGILECYAQGNSLLNGYATQLVSVHDPDEYIAAAQNDSEQAKRYGDVLDAYKALFELKAKGEVTAVGVGAKDWTFIRRLYTDVKFDWVMIANSFTVHSHPPPLVDFMTQLKKDDVAIINAAVFNGGFLTGGDFYNYKAVDAATAQGQALLNWRKRYFNICKRFGVDPAHAAMEFGLMAPGVQSIAISSGNPQRITANLNAMQNKLPNTFWEGLKNEGLIAQQPAH